ncbi:ABC transporter substrate-binding protein [Frankia sp. CNm7]|uniref:ABC transporter substrate-binding protein n=1 Tax=Frankia nepalensis TaxID=1836974 RepID=A0A937RR65_9ACTN|nr:ABC transporter substrate-binding protein [Frankia nepalensis]MBL7495220.1 ABC transporter substrate-binding protein [Frankia nepalensis]MBL7513215.1 ABC transporter substrate-binding protein [Frankia nepalensis]MBL7524110.1 ABC transporter substrate-binding protein [Frankia nepalensis]MBL7631193.1 ABC transporter substrate-binding protein [Frankia nepalensis]
MRSRTHRAMDDGPAVGRASRRTARRVLAATAAASLLAVLAACGGDSSDDDGATPPPSGNPSVAAALPAEYAGKTLKVATDATYPPNEYFDTDGKTIIGMDVDLIEALGSALGVEVEVENAGFDDILPGIGSKKYDIGVSSFTDTKEREEVVDFVTYYSAGTAFFTTADNGAQITTIEDLCGLSVAVETGTTQADAATAQDGKCKEAGKPGVTVQVFPDQNAANLALSSGRAQLGMADAPVAAYLVNESGGKLALVGEQFDTAPYGIAVGKGSGLAEPLKAALEQIIADGTYTKILEKWGMADGAITDPVINGAIS